MTDTETPKAAAILSIFAGVCFLIPLVFYLVILPAAGSSASHAKDAADFLPWMAEHSASRNGLWWTTVLACLCALFSAPYLLKRSSGPSYDWLGGLAHLAGVLGLAALVLAASLLVAGETPLARAYVSAEASLRPGIAATYEWQRLTTAVLFDFLGILMIGLWIGIVSIVALGTKQLSRSLAIFGLPTAALAAAFAVGYILEIGWLGELGIGLGFFFFFPAWLIWIGIAFLREREL